MTTPGWEQKLSQLTAIGEAKPALEPDWRSRLEELEAVGDSSFICLTSAQCDRILGQNGNPFCGPRALWRFREDDWPFKGKKWMWEKAKRMAVKNEA